MTATWLKFIWPASSPVPVFSARRRSTTRSMAASASPKNGTPAPSNAVRPYSGRSGEATTNPHDAKCAISDAD